MTFPDKKCTLMLKLPIYICTLYCIAVAYILLHGGAKSCSMHCTGSPHILYVGCGTKDKWGLSVCVCWSASLQEVKSTISPNPHYHFCMQKYAGLYGTTVEVA